MEHTTTAVLALITFIGLMFCFWLNKQWLEWKKVAENYKRLFDNIPTPMYIYDDRDFRFLAVNDAAIEQYGYSREEFLQLKLTDIRPPEDVPTLIEFHRALPKSHMKAGRWLHVNNTGQYFYVSVYTHHTIFEGKSARQVLIVNIDEKIRNEQILTEKSAELENILDSITDGFYALNRQWEVTFINKAAQQALSCSREEIMGKNLWEFFPRSTDGRFYAEYNRAMTDRVSVHFEELYAPLGVWGSMNVYPTRDGIAVYFADITEQKKNPRKNLQ